jgi:hypothetical protein
MVQDYRETFLDTTGLGFWSCMGNTIYGNERIRLVGLAEAFNR